jgi:16S rRNA (uracil1498-N3)-methyltransferase
MAHSFQFYVDPDHVTAQEFMIENQEHHHLCHVLRHQTGDDIQAVDGRGHRYHGTIDAIEKKCTRVRVRRTDFIGNDARCHLTLVQAVLKGPAFDWIVEKGTEIGISCFQPIITEHCHHGVRVRPERWRHIAIAAMKQSERVYCPVILPPVSFAEALRNYQNDPCFIAHRETDPDRPQDLRRLVSGRTRCAVFIGPEAGFTAQEFEQAIHNGVESLCLGRYRLRSETAGLVAAVKLFDAAGDPS